MPPSSVRNSTKFVGRIAYVPVAPGVPACWSSARRFEGTEPWPSRARKLHRMIVCRDAAGSLDASVTSTRPGPPPLQLVRRAAVRSTVSAPSGPSSGAVIAMFGGASTCGLEKPLPAKSKYPLVVQPVSPASKGEPRSTVMPKDGSAPPEMVTDSAGPATGEGGAFGATSAAHSPAASAGLAHGLHRGLGQGHPGGDDVRTGQPPVGRVLVPGHEGRRARFLDEEVGGPAQEVGAVQVLDRIDDLFLMDDIRQEAEQQVRLPLNYLVEMKNL